MPELTCVPTFSSDPPPLYVLCVAQINSLATLPLAERTPRETTLQSKRATVEAWLTREASTLQKYRLVGTTHTHAHACARCRNTGW